MEYIKEALIKEQPESASADLVFIVENLPKHLLLQEVDEQVHGPKGRMIVTGKKVDAPLPGIERGNDKYKSYVFNMGHPEGKDRLADIDRYIDSAFPRDQRIPKRVPFAAMPGVMYSGPLSYDEIPRVVLPVVPSVATPEAAAPEAPSLSDEEAKKEAARERMAKARAAKSAK